MKTSLSQGGIFAATTIQLLALSVALVAAPAAAASSAAVVWRADYISITEMPGGPDQVLILRDPGSGVIIPIRRENGDIGTALDVPLPFQVWLLGSGPYASFNVGAKGYITLGPSGFDNVASRGGADALLRDVPPKSVIAAWWGDHICSHSQSVLTKTLGDAPHRSFVIEWKDCVTKGGDAGFQAQIWLREGGAPIRVKYGDAEGAPLVDGERLNLGWGLKGRIGSGSLGPDRDGDPASCVPNALVGGQPRPCSVQQDFPSRSVIQYGLSHRADVAARLEIIDVELGASSLELELEVSVVNAGQQTARELGFDLRLVDRFPADPDEAEQIIHQQPPSETLEGGGTKTFGHRLSLPRPVHGAYSLCVQLDPSRLLDEEDTDNNRSCAEEELLLGPELTGTIVAPPVGTAGMEVVVPIELINQGRDPAGSFGYRIRMQEVGTSSQGSIVHEGSLESGLGAAGSGGVQSRQLNVTLTLPEILHGDAYHFVLEIDPAHEVPDFSRANNVVISAEPMQVNAPELRIDFDSLSLSLPDGCYFGSEVVAEFRLCNHGVVPASGFRPALILGDDISISLVEDVIASASPPYCGPEESPNFTPCEAQAGLPTSCLEEFCRAECRHHSDCGSPTLSCVYDPALSESLGRPASSCVNHLASFSEPEVERCEDYRLSGRIPVIDGVGDHLEAGEYRFHLIADLHLGSPQGPGYTTSFGAFECRSSLPDLAALEVIPHGPLVAGGTAIVSRRIANHGLLSPAAKEQGLETFTYAYVLGPSPHLSINQIVLPLETTGGPGLAQIGEQSTLEGIDRLSIPEGVRPGDYYFGLLLDPNDELEELEKSNNLFVFPEPIRISSMGLEVVTKELPRAVVGIPYSHSLIAAGATGPQRWSGEALPPGLSLAEDGLLHGVPSEQGRFAFAAGVHAGGSAAAAILALEVIEPSSPLSIATRRLPAAARGLPYGKRLDRSTGLDEEGVQLVANGGSPPYHWSLEEGGGRMPEGLEAPTREGIIYGVATPRAVSSRFRVVLRDALGNEQRASLEIEVLEADQLRIVERPFPQAVSGETYHGGCVTAQGGDGSYRWEVEEGSLPQGLAPTEEGAALCLEGTPTACGNFEVELWVVDGQEQRRAASLPLEVECGRILLRTNGLPPMQIGEEVELRLETFPSDEPTFLLYRGALPEGLELHPDGRLEGTVSSEAGRHGYDVIVELRDSLGRRSLSPLSLRIVEAPAKAKQAKQERASCSSSGSAASLPLAFLLALGLALLRRGPAATAGGPAPSTGQLFAASGQRRRLRGGARRG